MPRGKLCLFPALLDLKVEWVLEAWEMFKQSVEQGSVKVKSWWFCCFLSSYLHQRFVWDPMDSNLRKMCISDIICLIFSFDWFEEFLFDLNLDRLLSSFKAKGRQASILKTLCRYSISWHHWILLRQEILTIPLLSWTTHINIDIDILEI